MFYYISVIMVSVPIVKFYHEMQVEVSGNSGMLSVCATMTGVADVTFDPVNIVLSTNESMPGKHYICTCIHIQA